MPDLDVVDRAFDALTRDLAHSPAPGAPAAMATVRKRRRTRVGAVALATALVVGGGLTLPTLLLPEDGVAARGGSARLDASALDDATRGWITEWRAWDPASGEPGGPDGFSGLGCFSMRIPAGTEPDPTVRWDEPDPVAEGGSTFAGTPSSQASVSFSRYADAEQASSAQDQVYPPASTCSATTFIDVDGVQVRHDSMPREKPGAWETDVWSVQIGAERGQVSLVTVEEHADDATADRVAEALVAGLRDGWTQSGVTPIAPSPDDKPQLPAVMDSELTTALTGWRAASRSTASTIPDVPCLSAQVDSGSVSSSSSGTPRGVTWVIGGFDDDTTGPANVERMLDQIRSCTESTLSVSTVAADVTLVTYDVGGQDGNGALWLHSVGDRAMVTGVSGAAEPMPDGVADDVARVMDGWLRLPWE